MTPALALAELHAAGVTVGLDAAGAVLLHASQRPPAALLALARAHRDGIGALLRGEAHTPVPPTTPAPVMLAGVPALWREGVARLASMPAAVTIPPARWAALASTSHRLLHDHGAALHRAGWGALDLFGLDRTHPAMNPAGWGLAWLLREAGDVLDVTPDAVAMRATPHGALLVLRPRQGRENGAVPAWLLGTGA